MTKYFYFRRIRLAFMLLFAFFHSSTAFTKEGELLTLREENRLRYWNESLWDSIQLSDLRDHEYYHEIFQDSHSHVSFSCQQCMSNSCYRCANCISKSDCECYFSCFCFLFTWPCLIPWMVKNPELPFFNICIEDSCCETKVTYDANEVLRPPAWLDHPVINNAVLLSNWAYQAECKKSQVLTTQPVVKKSEKQSAVPVSEYQKNLLHVLKYLELKVVATSSEGFNCIYDCLLKHESQLNIDFSRVNRIKAKISLLKSRVADLAARLLMTQDPDNINSLQYFYTLGLSGEESIPDKLLTKVAGGIESDVLKTILNDTKGHNSFSEMVVGQLAAILVNKRRHCTGDLPGPI